MFPSPAELNQCIKARIKNNFKFGLHSAQKLISKVLFSKCIQLITILHERQLERFSGGENRKTSEKQHLLWVQERLIKQREKCLASLLSVASRQLGEAERFMSNRMKNRAVGPASVISLYLPGYRCVSASIFCMSLYHHYTQARQRFLMDSDTQRKFVSCIQI